MNLLEREMYDEGYVAGLEGQDPAHPTNQKYMEGFWEGREEVAEEMEDLDLN